MRTNHIPALAWTVLCCFIVGCSTTRSQSDFASIKGALPAATPVTGLPFSFLHQQVSGQFETPEGKKTRQIQVAVENSGSELVFVALSSSGLQLYKVQYDGRSVTSSAAAFVPADFEAWRIVSDFMAMYANSDALEGVLTPHGWSIETSTNGRSIRNSKDLVVLSIECAGQYPASCYRGGVVENHSLNYQLTIKTLAYENQPPVSRQPTYSSQRQHALGSRCRIARRPLHRACQY